jgi:hypothetical protein
MLREVAYYLFEGGRTREIHRWNGHQSGLAPAILVFSELDSLLFSSFYKIDYWREVLVAYIPGKYL